MLPAPRTSLIRPISVMARVNPKPVNKPSAAESRTGFLEAKLSALPKIIQLTTISGRNTPSDEYKSGTNLYNTILTTVTNVAIIRINAGILTSLGITFLRAEIIAFEQIKMNVTARPIPNELNTEDDMASVGQVPSTNLNVGLLTRMPFFAISLNLFPVIC